MTFAKCSLSFCSRNWHIQHPIPVKPILMIFFNSKTQSKVVVVSVIMHAGLDTDIRGGIEWDRLSTMQARSWGFVPIFPFGFRENSILKGVHRECGGGENTGDFSARPYSFANADRDEQRRHIARRRLPPKISKLFEAIRRATADTAIPTIWRRIVVRAVDNQVDVWFVKFADPSSMESQC